MKALAYTLSWLLWASLAVNLPLAAQAPMTRLTDWPKLKDAEQDKLRALVGQFKKPEVKLHEPARQQLIGLGEAAAPLLMQQVSDRADNVNVHLFAILDVLLTPRHSSLMAREAAKPRVELRRYLTLRLCRFGDAELVPFFTSLQKDPDELTKFYAHLGLLSHKQRAGLSVVHDVARQRWSEVGPLFAEVLPAARSVECGNWVWEAIAKASAVDQMTGLRLLRYLAVRDHAMILRGYLGAADHTVKREAVNTARVMHGQEPIENLPVFKVIEMAKEWQGKL